MAKLTRALQKIFCGGVPPINAVAVFGSLKAGSPEFSDDPADIQSLPAYEAGWAGATVLNQAPALQDMNALQFLFSRQLKYLFQQGIPEYSAEETYFIGSWVTNSTGVPYVSLVNDNLGNDLLDPTKWRIGVISSLKWSATSTYEYGDLATNDDGQIYVSLSNSNLNNALTNETKWELLVSRASVTGIAAGSSTINCQLNSTFSKTGSASATNIGLNNMAEGQTVTVLISTVAGQGAITWKRGTDALGVADIKWSNQVLPTPTTTAGRHDRYIFQKINGIIFGSADMNCY